MEEKERYEYFFGTNTIKDNKTNQFYGCVVDLLNQQDKELSKLRASYQQVKEENQQLKQQLAEYEKEIEKLNACVDFYKSYSVSFQEKVIDELERVKEKILPEISSYVKKEFVVKEFDNQINELKGKVEDVKD